MDENEKPRDEGAEEDTNHESAHEDQETTTNEDISEEECDEAIAELLATIARLEQRIAELETRIDGHERDNEHTARRIEPGAADGDVSPDERHWYFRKFRRE